MNNGLIIRNNRSFPSIFSQDVFEELLNMEPFKDFERFFGNSQVVPYDFIENKDKNGVVISNEIQYALAGYDKDNISIEIDEDRLNLKIEKIEKTDDSNKNYVHKGISQRRIEASYCINGYDKENISSSFENGILKITLPVTEKKQAKKIEVKEVKKIK